MNSNHPTTRIASLATCLAALFAGATAGGTEAAGSPTPAAAGGADLRELAAQAHASLHPSGFSDDRREPSASIKLHRTRQHAKR
jgi:hypothetical protein